LTALLSYDMLQNTTNGLTHNIICCTTSSLVTTELQWCKNICHISCHFLPFIYFPIIFISTCCTARCHSRVDHENCTLISSAYRSILRSSLTCWLEGSAPPHASRTRVCRCRHGCWTLLPDSPEEGCQHRKSPFRPRSMRTNTAIFKSTHNSNMSIAINKS